MATLATSTRYFNSGTTKVFFLPAIASAVLAPTRSEITAGTDLSAEIADIAGWTITASTIDTPDLGTPYTTNIPGRLTTDASSLTFYADKAGLDIRTLLPRDAAGFIVIADGGDVTGYKCDVFPVRVLSNGKPRGTGEDAARVMVPFSITKKPAENVTIPATV